MGDPFRDASTALARGTKGGPVAIADGTGSVLLDVDLAINHVSGKGIVAELLDEAGLSRGRWCGNPCCCRSSSSRPTAR